jgi:hypothetical protein
VRDAGQGRCRLAFAALHNLPGSPGRQRQVAELAAAPALCAPPLALPPPPSVDPTLLRRTFDAPPFFSFHHANAYEAGGNLVIDTVGGAGRVRSDVCR